MRLRDFEMLRETQYIDPIGRPITWNPNLIRRNVYSEWIFADGSNVEIVVGTPKTLWSRSGQLRHGCWQSDNDDDGNRGTRIRLRDDYGIMVFKDGNDPKRICELVRRMQYGRFDSTSTLALEDPGVVSKFIAKSYAGSQTGILV